MEKIRLFIILFLIIVFIIGFYATMYCNIEANKQEVVSNVESMDSIPKSCPDLLMKKGKGLVLYNTKEPVTEGKNPILFQSLDEYIEFIQNQKKKGIECPILYLQQETTTQGEDVYRIRPSPFDLQGGLSSTNTSMDTVKVADANRLNPPYNKNNYPGFDPQGNYVGVYTNLDAVHDSTQNDIRSDNPMDSNLGGVTHSREMVKSGKYKGREITKPVFNKPPNVSFFSKLPTHVEPPIDVL